MDVTSDRPTPEYLRLVATRPGELRRLMVRGERPDVAHLIGWEHRGTNLPATSALLGLRRFVKGFTTESDGAVVGYNKSVAGADLSTPWSPRPQRDGRVAWAPFTVAGVDPRLRDYLVRVEPGSDALLLGQADLAVGSRRITVGWFALERLGPVS